MYEEFHVSFLIMKFITDKQSFFIKQPQNQKLIIRRGELGS